MKKLLLIGAFLMVSCTANTTPDNSVNNSVLENEGKQVVIATNYSYTPSEIRAKPGETIILKSNEGVHDFVIETEVWTTKTENFSGEKTIEFTIPQDTPPGEYPFYCSIGRHRQFGMEGVLIIE